MSFDIHDVSANILRTILVQTNQAEKEKMFLKTTLLSTTIKILYNFIGMLLKIDKFINKTSILASIIIYMT